MPSRACVLASVMGDAGVGKTRLVAELLSRIGVGARIGEGRCLSYGEGITYWPLSQIVRQLAVIGEATHMIWRSGSSRRCAVALQTPMRSWSGSLRRWAS